MTAAVNGRLLSRGNSGSMYWTWPQLLAHASRDATLRPGDVLGSGTVGTGCILELTPEAAGGWLKPGDVVELTIERLGTLRNRVVAPSVSERQRKLREEQAMPPYLRLGSIPRKRHIVHPHEPGFKGEGIYYEEVVGLAGSRGLTASSITCGRRRAWSGSSRPGRSRPISAISRRCGIIT